ncbi:MAG: YraN family protein [Deltaproteobacteria bacterium]|nr:YraN family protein [Deltaproteobacteria bacterium]
MEGQKQILGKEGERIAETFLRKKGYRLVERNYRCPVGELDLVLLDRRVLVFVEVKTRTDDRFGGPLEAVHPRKQHKMVKAALFFLSQHRLHHREARFDVVGISWKDREPLVEHVQNAFEIS